MFFWHAGRIERDEDKGGQRASPSTTQVRPLSTTCTPSATNQAPNNHHHHHHNHNTIDNNNNNNSYNNNNNNSNNNYNNNNTSVYNKNQNSSVTNDTYDRLLIIPLLKYSYTYLIYLSLYLSQCTYTWSWTYSTDMLTNRRLNTIDNVVLFIRSLSPSCVWISFFLSLVVFSFLSILQFKSVIAYVLLEKNDRSHRF